MSKIALVDANNVVFDIVDELPDDYAGYYGEVDNYESCTIGEVLGRYLGAKPNPNMQIEMEKIMSVSSITFVYLAQTEQLDDVTITEHATLFPEWDENWRGKRNDIVRDGEGLYRSIHDVTDAGQNRKPSETPSMWTPIGNPADEWPPWSQPLGGHDAYPLGAKVTYNDKRWISTTDNNVWVPGVFGWEEFN